MDVETKTQVDQTRCIKIRPGDVVMLRLANGSVRSIKAEKDATFTIGRLGSFSANDLIGELFGRTYEVDEKHLKLLPHPSVQEVEETDATNELINDGQFVQPVTLDEIEALKQSGVHASDIIKKQIEQHANYSLKTEYSKEKYKKRKEAKYSKTFTTIEPTLFNVCEYWFSKDQNRVRDIRSDTLSQILNLANVRPGGRYLAVDDASGLLVSGILERLGGSGRLITICDTDSPPAYPVLSSMNFSSDAVNQVMLSLNWSTAGEEYRPYLDSIDRQEEARTEKQKARVEKRKAASDALDNTRQELFAGEFDGLVIASEYDPYSIVMQLSKYLAGSASIVVHNPYIQVLSDLQSKLRALPMFLGPSLTEPWLRRYQVLPGRTHPMMSTSGTGGYLLHAIKVHDDASASSVLAHRRPTKKRHVEVTESNHSNLTQQPGEHKNNTEFFPLRGSDELGVDGVSELPDAVCQITDKR